MGEGEVREKDSSPNGSREGKPLKKVKRGGDLKYVNSRTDFFSTVEKRGLRKTKNLLLVKRNIEVKG